MSKTVTIATLVRNREFIIPLYLKHLYQLNYPKNLINILWVVNNSNDSSLLLLQEFKKQYEKEYNRIRIEELNVSNLPEDKRDIYIRNNFTYSHLSNLRNLVCSKTKTDYLFQIDSDILLTDSETLNKLIQHSVDVVSSIIYNGYEFSPNTPWQYTNAMQKIQNGFKHLSRLHIREIKQKGESLLQNIDLTGAICLISRKVLDNKKIKYAPHPTGEDAFWSNCVKHEGFKMYVDLNCYNQHIMNKECLDLYLKGELKF